MTEKHMCDCNQGRMVCRCKEPAPVPPLTEYSPSKKAVPPDAPPMRTGAPSADKSGIAIFIIVSMAVGIACGWQMHGGICS